MSKAPIDSIIELTAYDPEARNDPHTKLKALRGCTAAFRDEAAKAWFLTRYDDVRPLANDHDMWRHPMRAEEGAFIRSIVPNEEAAERTRGSILFMDDPDHARVRPPLAKAFYARINDMKAELEAIVDKVLDGAPRSGRFDLMSEIAVPVPILVIARILGVEAERIEDFRAWSEAVVLGLNPLRSEEETERMLWGREALDDYFADCMEARRKNPADDLVTDMVELQAQGAELDDEEVRINLEALLVGGNLTTTDLIGNGVWLFLTNDRERQKLAADPTLAGAAVEEILRYESPVAVTNRILPDSREIAGCPMHSQQSVMLSLHSANRDANKFEDADCFNITRERIPHVAFGGGSHICIGAPLARLEGARVFARLFERFPNMSLPEQDLTWRALPFFRGLETLFVDV